MLQNIEAPQNNFERVLPSPGSRKVLLMYTYIPPAFPFPPPTPNLDQDDGDVMVPEVLHTAFLEDKQVNDLPWFCDAKNDADMG